MAYGRIDVYWPDGPVESYQLEKPSVAVGRSTGNDIVLDTTAVSRYHISVSRKDQLVYLEDLESVNGTYIDGERVKPREPVILVGGEEIQVGDIRLVYIPQQEVELATRPMLPESVLSTQQVDIQQEGLRLVLEPPPQPVTPGAYIQANLTIENVGDITERYIIEVEGVPPEWVRVDRKQIELDPGMSIPVVISFKPLRRSESAPGDYLVRVRVKGDSQILEAPMRLVVRPYSGFGMVLGTPTIEGGQPFELYVENHGTSSLPLVIKGAAPDGNMVFNIQPTAMTLVAGETRIVHGYVASINKPLFGSKIERRYDLLVRSQDASGFLAAVQGTLVERARVPIWVPTVLIPILLLLCVGGAILTMLYLGRPRVPTFVTAPQVSPDRVVVGAPVTVKWSVTDTDNIVIRMDGGTTDVDPKDGQYTQAMTTPGEATISIEAHKGDQVVTRDLHVTVVQSFKINSFVISPNPMLRYVRQDVMISWNVEGATTVRLVGLEGLTGKPEADNQPATGQMVLNGTPRDTIQLQLVATAPNGDIKDQSVTVEIKNPVCTANADQVKVYSGPGENYPVLRNFAKAAELIPDGQDKSGQWLHLAPSPDPQAWVRVSDVQCTGFNPGALITIAVVPPLPTATELPTNPPAIPSSSPPSGRETPVPTLSSSGVMTRTPAGQEF